jgi:hypothetical protein
METNSPSPSKPAGDSVLRLVRALRRIEKDWPEGLMLFSNNGSLHLMRGHPEDGGKSMETFTIPSDGGDTFIE